MSVDGLRWRMAALARICVAIAGVAALIIAALCAVATIDAVTDPNLNTNRNVGADERRSIATLGAIGVLASLLTGIAGLACAKSPTRTHRAGLVLGIAFGLPRVFAFVDAVDDTGIS